MQQLRRNSRTLKRKTKYIKMDINIKFKKPWTDICIYASLSKACFPLDLDR